MFNSRELSMYVCLCTGITDHDIRESIAEGASSLEEVMYLTGAATRCGTCRPIIAAMLEQEASPRSVRRSLRIVTTTAA